MSALTARISASSQFGARIGHGPTNWLGRNANRLTRLASVS